MDNGWVDEMVSGWMNGRLDERVCEWMGGGWTDRWMNRRVVSGAQMLPTPDVGCPGLTKFLGDVDADFLGGQGGVVEGDPRVPTAGACPV